MARFNISPAFIILYVLGLSLLFSLSIWQYQRGLLKQQVAQLRAADRSAELSAAPQDWSPLYYRDSQLHGRWLNEFSLLLENRINAGQVGFEVLTPFIMTDDQAVLLVNRGWVATPQQALAGPGTGAQSLSGVIYAPQPGLQLGEAILPGVLNTAKWPKKSLYIDLPLFARALGRPLQPVMLVLDDDHPAAFVRIWTAVVMPAAKHFGYAVQWLGLALTMLIYGFIWFRRKH